MFPLLNTSLSLDPPAHPANWFYATGHFHVDKSYGFVRDDGYFASTIFFTIGGRGKYIWQDNDYLDDPMSLTILPEGNNRNGWMTESDEWEFYWALFKGPCFIEYAAQFELTFPLFNIPLPPQKSILLKERYQALMNVSSEKGPRATMNQQREGLSFYQLVLEMIIQQRESQNRPFIYGKDLLGAMNDYLASNTTGQDRVDEFASQTGISPEHITRTLKKYTGKTPKQYFLDYRVRQAKEWLLTSTMTIGEIGIKVGFPDPYHFSKLFKQQTGLSPQNYRKQNPMTSR